MSIEVVCLCAVGEPSQEKASSCFVEGMDATTKAGVEGTSQQGCRKSESKSESKSYTATAGPQRMWTGRRVGVLASRQTGRQAGKAACSMQNNDVEKPRAREGDRDRAMNHLAKPTGQ